MARLGGGPVNRAPFLHAPTLAPNARIWPAGQLGWRPVQGEAAERFVVFGLRVAAVCFVVVGLLYLFVPSPTLDVISDVGELLGNHNRAPHTQEYMWLSAWLRLHGGDHRHLPDRQADVVRFRPLILLLAAGEAASSLTSLAFFLTQGQVFAYLLGFLVDGSLILLSIWLWALVGRIDRRPFEGRRGGRGLGGPERRTLASIATTMAPGVDGAPAAEREVAVAEPVADLLASIRRASSCNCASACGPSSGCRSHGASSHLDQAGREAISSSASKAHDSRSNTTCC